MIQQIEQLNENLWYQISERVLPGQITFSDRLIALITFPIALVTEAVTIALKVVEYSLSLLEGYKINPTMDDVCNDSRYWDRMELDMENATFDQVGVATCTYQDSGAYHCPNSQWATWEKKQVPAANRSGKSAGLYELYRTDPVAVISRLKELGVNTYRFSIEWSHIMPRQGEVNRGALAIYRQFCQALKKDGIRVSLTMHHFSEPKWFHDLGSFEKEENIGFFTNFCQLITEEIPEIDEIFTINEPTVDTFSRYLRGAFSPGYFLAFNRAGGFLLNMYRAHAAAYKAIKSVRGDVPVGITHQYLRFLPGNPLFAGLARAITRIVNHVALDLFNKKHFAFKIPFVANIQEEIPDWQLDIIGVQYYTRVVVNVTGSTSHHEPMTEMPFREDPAGIYEAIVETGQATGVPVIVSENGISTSDEVQRERYMRRSLFAQKEAAKKVRVLGTYHWAFTRNFEWDLGMRPQDFGAYKVDDQGVIEKNPRDGIAPFIAFAKRSCVT